MNEKFRGRFRIPSNRWYRRNYASSGAYFVTICTKWNFPYFGKVLDGEMILSELGKIAFSEWETGPFIRPDQNISLGDFVVMPNHIHGIVVIGDNRYNAGGTFGDGGDARHRVSTEAVDEIPFPENQFGPQRKNLASIIRGYKSAVTMYARENAIPFRWQSRYHDHVIRNQTSYERISNYIRKNPQNWKEDQFYI